MRFSHSRLIACDFCFVTQKLHTYLKILNSCCPFSGVQATDDILTCDFSLLSYWWCRLRIARNANTFATRCKCMHVCHCMRKKSNTFGRCDFFVACKKSFTSSWCDTAFMLLKSHTVSQVCSGLWRYSKQICRRMLNSKTFFWKAYCSWSCNSWKQTVSYPTSLLWILDPGYHIDKPAAILNCYNSKKTGG